MVAARGVLEYEVASGAATGEPLTLRIETRTDAIVAGHSAVRFALAAGVSRRAAGAFGIAASELATNIVRHAGGRDGWIELRAEPGALVLVATDRGPGDPAVVRACLAAEHTAAATAGPFMRDAGLGCGVAAVGRLMTDVRVEGRAGGGLRIVARCAR